MIDKTLPLAALGLLLVPACLGDEPASESADNAEYAASYGTCAAEANVAKDACVASCDDAYADSVFGEYRDQDIRRPLIDASNQLLSDLQKEGAAFEAARKAVAQCQEQYDDLGATCYDYQSEARKRYLELAGRPANYFDDPNSLGFDPFDQVDLDECLSDEGAEERRQKIACLTKINEAEFPDLIASYNNFYGALLNWGSKQFLASVSKAACKTVSCGRAYQSTFDTCLGTCSGDVELGTACVPAGVPSDIDCGAWTATTSEDACSCNGWTWACGAYQASRLLPWAGDACPVLVDGQYKTGSTVWIVGKNEAKEADPFRGYFDCRLVDFEVNEKGEVNIVLSHD